MDHKDTDCTVFFGLCQKNLRCLGVVFVAGKPFICLMVSIYSPACFVMSFSDFGVEFLRERVQNFFIKVFKF